MNFTTTALPGVVLASLSRRTDHRGYFARGWCAAEFAAHGLNPHAVQLNVGFSHLRGTLRGMHYQAAPHAEAKQVRCTRGVVFDAVVDLRPDSPTFCRWLGVELSADNGDMLCVPEGCAHGYQTLTDGAEIHYLTSEPYHAGSARGFRFDDPAFDIKWPLPVAAISAADLAWPVFPFRPEAGVRTRNPLP